MSTLLRLLGDSNQSNTEVRNSFKEPVLIKADSQIALTGVSALLKTFDVPANSVMQVGAGGANVGGGAPYKQVGARITQGSYTSYGFAKEAELAFNYPIVDASSVSVLQSQLLGVDEKITIDSGYLNVETRQTNMANVVLDDWLSTFDDPFEISGNSFTATDVSGDKTVLASPNRIPRLSSKITATFENCSTIEAGLQVVDFGDVSYSYWGVQSGTNWFLTKGDVLDPDTIDTDIACSDGDTLTMYQYGGVVTIVVGTETFVSPAGWVPRSVFDRNSQTLSYQVFAETDGEVSNIQATELDGPDLAANLKNEVSMQAGIQFKNLAGVNQPELADYFGFPREFDPIQYRGNPAILVAGSPMQAIPNWSGIIVCLEGIGLLKSFDGSKDTKSPSNILYVINELKGVNNESLQIDFPSPIYLNLKNGKDVNISDLRIRMLEASGFNPVKFDGKPSFTLVVRERRGAK
jgi:hypothetical protein